MNSTSNTMLNMFKVNYGKLWNDCQNQANLDRTIALIIILPMIKFITEICVVFVSILDLEILSRFSKK